MRNTENGTCFHVVIREDNLRVNLCRLLDSKPFILEYVCVFHKKPESVPHYHIWLKVIPARSRTDIARMFVIKKGYVDVSRLPRAQCLSYFYDSKSKYELICSRYEKKAL